MVRRSASSPDWSVCGPPSSILPASDDIPDKPFLGPLLHLALFPSQFRMDWAALRRASAGSRLLPPYWPGAWFRRGRCFG